MVDTRSSFPGGAASTPIKVMPPVWQSVALVNPVVYLINGFRWSFYGIATAIFAICLAVVWWIFKTGDRFKR
jgi:ABC-2 type transport system permease protein